MLAALKGDNLQRIGNVWCGIGHGMHFLLTCARIKSDLATNISVSLCVPSRTLSLVLSHVFELPHCTIFSAVEIRMTHHCLALAA